VRFSYDAKHQVLFAGPRPFPVAVWRSDNGLEDIPGAADFLTSHPHHRMYTRQALVPCENKWVLSVIWGDATYSSNRMLLLSERGPFIEEPELVFVVRTPPHLLRILAASSFARKAR